MTHRALNRTASYWTAAAVAAVALWTSGAPTTTYPLYDSEWHLTPAVTTTVFAVYPLTLVVVLLVFGDLADHIGRRATILWGLLAMLIGAALFAVAPGIGVVFAGRALMGIGVGLALSPASAAVLEFSTPGRERAAGSVTTAGTAAGLVLATLVGGVLVQYGPWPLHLDFWVLAAAITALGAVVWFLPRHIRDEAHGPWRPRAITVARGIRRTYVVAALAMSVAFMFGAVYLALGAQIGEQLIGTHDLLVVGSILAMQSVTIGIVALATRAMPPRLAISIGAATVLLSFALLLESMRAGSLPLFLVTTVIGGAAYSLSFSGGLALIGQNAPAHHRAGTISAAYLAAYVLQGCSAIALGMVATNAGLLRAVGVGAVTIGAFAVAELVVTRVLRPRAAAVPAVEFTQAAAPCAVAPIAAPSCSGRDGTC